MKRYLIYFIVFLIIIFILPAICTKSSGKQSIIQEKVVEETKQEEEKIKTYDYSKYEKIKLYHTKTNNIEELPIDEYIYGTVSAEMPAKYELEALKAQAIVSRTYTLYQIINGKNKHGEAYVCDDYKCCQAWISKDDRMNKWDQEERESNWDKIVNAVNSTSGMIVTYNKEPIDAFFHSNSGGKTETVSNVWGGKDFPYLQSVETVGEDGYSQYKSEVKLSKNELVEKLKTKYTDIKIDWNNKECIKILDYTDSQRVKTIRFGNVEVAGTEARTLLGLKSNNFIFKIEGDNIIFSVTGYGHGVGMSQTGADSMAKAGKNYEDIIKHFYTGVEITYINDL
ncbi:MAG: stage II sporulation protein D [Clostridia bacterium]|nr:stage II sporulation protein D [Clostridia bacterium]